MSALLAADAGLPLTEVADGLYWGRVYWMQGATPKGADSRSEINSGVPHLGWGGCFVIDKDPAAKTVTLFSPYRFEGFTVTRQSSEYRSLRYGDFSRSWHERNFLYKWEEAIKNKWQRDFGTAAVVMKMMGMDVPMDIVPEGMEIKETGGKQADVLGLLKPVKRNGRRGQVLAFFLAGEGRRRSIHEALPEFQITRSNLLSQLYLLQKDHGIGYKVTGDVVSVTMPEGCVDPFEPEA